MQSASQYVNSGARKARERGEMLNGNERAIRLRRLQGIYLLRAEFKGGSSFQQDLEKKETKSLAERVE